MTTVKKAFSILLAAVLYFVIMKVARVKILDECIAFILRR